MENIREIRQNDIFYDIPYQEFIKSAMSSNFFHSRINDGEYNAIQSIKNTMNVNNMNSDFCNYFYELGVDLRQILIEYVPSDNYIISSGNNWFYDYPTMFKEVYSENSNLRLHNGYFYYDILMNPPYFENFIEFLKQKRVVIIGPAYMGDIKLFENFELIEVPRRNAYLSKNEIINKIIESDKSDEITNYCFCAGMVTPVIIHYFSKIDKKNSYFNIGSVWDYFFQSDKYDMITHRNIFNKLVTLYNSYYEKFIVK